MLVVIVALIALLFLLCIVLVALLKKNIKKFSFSYVFPLNIYLTWETKNQTSKKKTTSS